FVSRDGRLRCPAPFPYTTLFRSVVSPQAQNVIRSGGLCRVLHLVSLFLPRNPACGGIMYNKILVPLDGSGRAEAILRHVQTLAQDRKSTRLNSSHVKISYAVFCL